VFKLKRSSSFFQGQAFMFTYIWISIFKWLNRGDMITYLALGIFAGVIGLYLAASSINREQALFALLIV
jgi:hypothetical protein